MHLALSGLGRANMTGLESRVQCLQTMWHIWHDMPAELVHLQGPLNKMQRCTFKQDAAATGKAQGDSLRTLQVIKKGKPSDACFSDRWVLGAGDSPLHPVPIWSSKTNSAAVLCWLSATEHRVADHQLPCGVQSKGQLEGTATQLTPITVWLACSKYV